MPVSFRQAPATFLVCLAAIGFTALYHAGRGVELVEIRYTAFTTEPWRLFTSTLVHGGLIHLVFNLYWTWTFGRVIEGRLGSLVTGALFVAIAAGSGAAQYAVGSGGIGLSGVVYGFVALLWIADRKEPMFGGVVTPSITRLFVIWFFICIFMTRSGMMPIANTAHGIGAALGLAAGWLLVSPARMLKLRTGLLAVALSLCFVAATAARPMLASPRYLAGEAFEKALDAHEAGHLEEAGELWRQSAEFMPDLAEAWYNYGLFLVQRGDREAARRAFREAREAVLRRDPEEGGMLADIDDRLRELGR